MEKRCWIVGAGDFCARGWSPKAGDLVIAADGGQGGAFPPARARGHRGGRF